MDFTLTDQQRHLQQVARAFAYEEIQPTARELDPALDPADCFPAHLVRRASALGLRTLKIPVEYGGLAADCLTECIVLEELCVGDIGFGMTLNHDWREGYILACFTTPEQRERFLPEFLADDGYLTSYANTEEHSGSDNSLPYVGSLQAGPRTSAVLQDGQWVINGRKIFITNANVARLIILFARTDPSMPWTQGVSAILVPTNTPGFWVGRIENKLGIRLNQNGELIFEDCRVPEGNLLGELNRGRALAHAGGAGGRTKEGIKSLGVARAAYEAALAWGRERTWGGELLVSQQAIQVLLADMAMEIELARTLCWRAAWAVDHDRSQADLLESIAKVYSGEMSVRVALRAYEIFGADGARRDLPIEKLVRDSTAMLHAGGGNAAYRTRIARVLTQAPH